MLVVFLFLRRAAATIAAGVTVPLSLAGTCAMMWVAGFSIDNLSLMALAVSVGFVVDDAIVMIENCFRNLEKGMTPFRAAIEGAQQIGFTVLAISISLVAAFIPLLFMSGVVGRVFREFSVTLAFAIAVSTAVSLTLTPMICAHFVRKPPSPDATWLDRAVEWVLGVMVRGYARSLAVVLNYRALTLLIMAATVVITGMFYARTPKGYFPQDDTGLIWGGTQASTEVSFQAMYDLQQKAEAIARADPAVANIGSSIGTSGFSASVNRGSLFISLKPLAERGGLSAQAVATRLRLKTADIPGLRVFFFPMQDVRVGGRQSDSSYQYTLWDTDYNELLQWAPRVFAKIQTVPGLVDVSTDREQGGLQVNVSIDRVAASRMGVRVQDIANALNNSYAQRQISTLYTQRNQYRVILEIDPQYQRDPSDLDRIYVSGANNTQVPLNAVTKIERGLSPLVVNHQGQFPAITVSFGLGENVTIEQATRLIDQAVAEMHIPDTLHAEFAGDARAYRMSVGAQPILIIAALIAVYIVLGVLYESLAHPLTIISTLPSAGLGALLALQIFSTELSSDRVHRDHPPDRHRQEEWDHDGRLRARGGAQARPRAGAGDLRGLPRSLPSDHDDDHGGAARRGAAADRDRAGSGAAPSARHHHRGRAAGVAVAHALHDAGDLSPARQAAPGAVGRPRPPRARTFSADRGAGTAAVVAACPVNLCGVIAREGGRSSLHRT